MKETVIETPLIGSGSQEEVILASRHCSIWARPADYLTYEELNEKLPDEVVSPDKLDSLLMMIDEMGIKLIDEGDIGELPEGPQAPARSTSSRRKSPKSSRTTEGEVIDLNLEAELAEASTKRIDDPVRMYLTQMGEIPLLTREQEIALAKKIEITRKIFRSKVLESDYCLQSAVEILQQVDDGDLPFDRTMKISTAEDNPDKGDHRPAHSAEPRLGSQDARPQPRRLGRARAGQEQEGPGRASPGDSPPAPPVA